MSRFSFFIALLASLFFVGRASAQTETPGTPTLTPVPLTPTSTPDLSYCPEGLPEGWGTVTPSYLWMDTCQACLDVLTPADTPTPQPSVTPGGPTLTPSPTVTVSPTPPAGVFYPPNNLMIGDLYGCGAFGCDANSWTFDYSCVDYGSSMTCLVDWMAVDGRGDYDMWGGLGMGVTAPVQGTTYYFGSKEMAPGVHIYDRYVYQPVPYELSTWGYLAQGSDPHLVNTVYDPYNGGLGLWLFTVGGQGTWTGQMCLFMSTSEITDFSSCEAGTPTPYPTSVPLTCGSVGSEDPNYGFSFEIFVPDGPMTCGGWAETGVGDNFLPPFELCFQPSQFGVVRLFAVEFELGTLAVIAAAAWIWRYLRTV